MLKLTFLLTCLSVSQCYHITKMNTEVTVADEELLRNEHLPLHGEKKINKALIEHIFLRNCSGVIDGTTFKHFPKLYKLTIGRSNIQEVSTTLPITHLVSMGSHLPNLDQDLQQKLPKIKAIMMLGNKNFEVDSSILKNFKHLQALYISEANFTQDCVTKDWFKGMDSLEELGLSDNGLDCITEGAFNSLRTLRKLDLTYNHLPNLSKKLFKKLTKLEKLGLYENDMDYIELSALASQKNHLDELGISWKVLQNSNISAENLLRALPNLKSISFGLVENSDNWNSENNWKAEYCGTLRENGVTCTDADLVFGASTLLGFSRLVSGQ